MSTPTSTTTIASPYPGLRPFEPHEAEIFFGRGEQIDRMLSRLEEHRFLAVVGASGCGKSSLVRAGLFRLSSKAFLKVEPQIGDLSSCVPPARHLPARPGVPQCHGGEPAPT